MPNIKNLLIKVILIQNIYISPAGSYVEPDMSYWSIFGFDSEPENINIFNKKKEKYFKI